MKKIVIVSGYFNPLHGGHLDLFDAASKLGDNLIVIVNNDKQAIMKKGVIIIDENTRLRIVESMKQVDAAVLSIDSDRSCSKTLDYLRHIYKKQHLIFANGGDVTEKTSIPEAETCKRLNIDTVYGVGGIKTDSSTRINNLMAPKPIEREKI